jgi:hypothetical protein
VITIYTEDQLTASALAYFRVSFANSSTPVDLSDRSFLGLLARAFARFFVLMQSQVMQANNDAIPAYQQDADGNLRRRRAERRLNNGRSSLAYRRMWGESTEHAEPPSQPAALDFPRPQLRLYSFPLARRQGTAQAKSP